MQFRMFLPLVLLAWTPLTAAAQPPTCSFVLGFAALHSAIPDIVGDCLTNESHGPINGDALQSTTNGLLVWRKSDSLTAFTNGSRTWVDGPFGIQMRLDTQRFSWEPNPDGLAIIPTPTPGDRCHTGGLAFTLVGTDPGAGNVLGTFLFTNQLDVNCTFFGFPGAQLIDADGNPLPTNVVRDGAFANQPPPQTVVVPAHGKARFLMHWEQVPVGGETTCPESSGLAVIPPDEFLPLTIPVHIRACGQGRLDIGAVQPDSSAA
jgi:hypothetical protein